MSDERTFEQALAELEECVRKLDSGELPLEESIRVFEQGVRLQAECQELLDAAEQRVLALSRSDEGVREKPVQIRAE